MLKSISERLNDSRYETMVAGISQTLEQVSRDIAREIIKLSKVTTSDKAVRPNP